MIRVFDILISSIALTLGMPVLAVITALVSFESASPIFTQVRVGQNCKNFKLYKFRTMRTGTPNVPTHKIDHDSCTKLGVLLRRSKLDELPQLWNVLVGDLSIVGPRPCLPSQRRLISQRRKRGVYNVRPGITGLGQVSGVDMSQPDILAEIDAQMLSQPIVKTYFSILFKTILGKGLNKDRLGPYA